MVTQKVCLSCNLIYSSIQDPTKEKGKLYTHFDVCKKCLKEKNLKIYRHIHCNKIAIMSNGKVPICDECNTPMIRAKR